MSKKRTAVQQRPAPRPAPGRRPPVRRSRMPAWLLPVALAFVALAVIVAALVLYSQQRPSSSPTAAPLTAATGQPVSGIQCQTSEQLVYHIHAHLAIFADGQPRTVPAGIGIPGQCIYWLHTHDTDGIIHIESPDQRTYTLGNFFDVWGQTLSPTAVGPARGTVTALYNGRLFRGNPRDIPLTRHAQIQLEVGRPLVAPVATGFPAGL